MQEYIDALFAWQQRWKPINALISKDLPGIKVAAERSETLPRDRYPLAGIPIVLKDNIDQAGVPTTAGSPGLRIHVPSASAPMLNGLMDKGAIVMGKAALHELAAAHLR